MCFGFLGIQIGFGLQNANASRIFQTLGANIDEVQHRIIREAMRLVGFRTPQIEITTLADIPAGTGLGSSGSFTTALLRAGLVALPG